MPARATTLACLLWAALSFSGILRAETIEFSVSDFAVYAGGSFGADRSVHITGDLGAGGNIWFDRDARLDGSAYAGGTFGVARSNTVTGRIVATSSVSIDRDSTVGSIDSGRDVWLGKSAVSGAIVAGRNVDLSSEATVTSDVSYGGKYWASGSAGVSGSVSRGASPDAWSTAARTAPVFSPASGSKWYAKGSTVTLNPGAYGSVSVAAESVVRLTSGEYHLKSLWLDRETQFIADTSAGDVTVYLSGSLSTGREVVFASQGGGALTFQSGGDVYLGREAQVNANLIAFGGISVDAFSSINGGMYAARNIWLDQGVSVGGGFGSASGQNVPEPASMAIAFAGLCLIVRRRRRMRAAQ